MKELKRFRQFLTEGKITENVSPAVIDFLDKYTPEEAPGSWDDVNNEFVVPYNHEELGYSEVDVQDFLYDTGLTLADLPTEYVEITNYQVGDQNRPVTARNFAKYVPGKGLYYKMTTELAEGELNENEEYKNMTFSARTLFDLIARDLKFSPLYQDDVQLSYNDALQIMDYITQAEESDMSAEAALGEYIATGEFK